MALPIKTPGESTKKIIDPLGRDGNGFSNSGFERAHIVGDAFACNYGDTCMFTHLEL